MLHTKFHKIKSLYVLFLIMKVDILENVTELILILKKNMTKFWIELDIKKQYSRHLFS